MARECVAPPPAADERGDTHPVAADERLKKSPVTTTILPEKRKRGRPPKRKPSDFAADAPAAPQTASGGERPGKKERRRVSSPREVRTARIAFGLLFVVGTPALGTSFLSRRPFESHSRRRRRPTPSVHPRQPVAAEAFPASPGCTTPQAAAVAAVVAVAGDAAEAEARDPSSEGPRSPLDVLVDAASQGKPTRRPSGGSDAVKKLLARSPLRPMPLLYADRGVGDGVVDYDEIAEDETVNPTEADGISRPTGFHGCLVAELGRLAGLPDGARYRLAADAEQREADEKRAHIARAEAAEESKAQLELTVRAYEADASKLRTALAKTAASAAAAEMKLEEMEQRLRDVDENRLSAEDSVHLLLDLGAEKTAATEEKLRELRAAATRAEASAKDAIARATTRDEEMAKLEAELRASREETTRALEEARASKLAAEAKAAEAAKFRAQTEKAVAAVEAAAAEVVEEGARKEVAFQQRLDAAVAAAVAVERRRAESEGARKFGHGGACTPAGALSRSREGTPGLVLTAAHTPFSAAAAFCSNAQTPCTTTQTPAAAEDDREPVAPPAPGPAPASQADPPERGSTGVRKFIARHFKDLHGEPASLCSLLESSEQANFSAEEVLSVLAKLSVDTPRRAAAYMVTIHEI